jgi:hypothetical protein
VAYDQLAGAFYGVVAIPAEWKTKLARRVEIERLADALDTTAASPSHSPVKRSGRPRVRAKD